MSETMVASTQISLPSTEAAGGAEVSPTLVTDRTVALRTATPHHPTFYFVDVSFRVFEVEECLFRVHTHFLAKHSSSPEFINLVSTSFQPGAAGAPALGSDGNPISLVGVTSLAFSTLLRFVYEGAFPGFALTLEESVALLSITSHYKFLQVHEFAVKRLLSAAQFDPVQVIALAEKHACTGQDVIPSILVLVSRPVPLRAQEIAQLSSITVARIAEARELFARTRRPEDRTAFSFKAGSSGADDAYVPMPWPTRHPVDTPALRKLLSSIWNMSCSLKNELPFDKPMHLVHSTK